MASARVEHMLDEIAQLSREEQAELLRDLPHVLHDEDAERKDRILGGLQLAAVQQAIELRERIRQRLASAAQSSGYINDDLDTIREERLGELMDDAANAPQDAGQ